MATAKSSSKKAPPNANSTNILIRTEAFTLNKIKALKEKQKAGCRPADMVVKVTGGGVVITFSAAMYEAFRYAVSLANYPMKREDYDVTGTAKFREVIRVTNGQNRKLYTINLYPTKTRAMINGSKYSLQNHFLNKDFPYMVQVINQALQQMGVETKEMNKSIVQAIDVCLSELGKKHMPKGTKTSTPTGNPVSLAIN